MKIVIDTNIIISGLFFGGFPRLILDNIVESNIEVYASSDIIDEYNRVITKFTSNYNMPFDNNLLLPLIKKMIIIEPSTKIDVCRDKDDNKFIECAKEAGAKYLVSGDSDLLVLKNVQDIEIVTAKELAIKLLVTGTCKNVDFNQPITVLCAYNIIYGERPFRANQVI